RAVGIGLGVVDPLDHAFEAHLAALRRPPEQERRLGNGRELARLAALEIGVESEAAPVYALEQHGARRGLPGRVDGRERHPVRLEDRRGARLLEPARELLERIGDHVRLAQAALAVLLPHAGQVVHRSHLRAALLAAARADWQAEGLASAPNLREVTRR